MLLFAAFMGPFVTAAIMLSLLLLLLPLPSNAVACLASALPPPTAAANESTTGVRPGQSKLQISF